MGWGTLINIPGALRDTLTLEYKKKLIYPNINNLLRAFEICPYEELKVVIIGQDPYFRYPDEATGIAFGNPAGTRSDKLSPSLQLIKNRIQKDFYSENPADFNFDCTLESWAKQGILLLNSTLTVESGNPGSHTDLWAAWMKNFLLRLGARNTGLVYILLGKQAQGYEVYIDKENNYIFKYNHPAYYTRKGSEFICDGFKKAQEIIQANNNITLKF